MAAGIKALETNAWRPWNNAARYLWRVRGSRSGDDADRSPIAMKEDWFNVWTKAQIVAAKGKAAEACPLAQKAQALGGTSEGFFFAAEVKKAIADWKCKQVEREPGLAGELAGSLGPA